MMFVALLACVALASAHMKIYSEPNLLPIRNANLDRCKVNNEGVLPCVRDGEFSVAQDGCGGQTEWGHNEYGIVKVGQVLNLKFNYGTGTNGDHAANNNAFRVIFLETKGMAASEVTKALQDAESEYILVDNIAAKEGSRPEAYYARIEVPFECERCVLGVLDQRNWGGCLDLRTNGTFVKPTEAPVQPDVCGNGVLEADIGEECDGETCCTGNCKWSRGTVGCPCNTDFSCDEGPNRTPYYCECFDQDDCDARDVREPRCSRNPPSEGAFGAASATLLAGAALVGAAAALIQ